MFPKKNQEQLMFLKKSRAFNVSKKSGAINVSEKISSN